MRPRLDLARRVLSPPLLKALLYIFDQHLPRDAVMLVGGTALAGFYAGHRRSDDLDLFVRDSEIHLTVVKAVQALEHIGVQRVDGLRTSQYYRCTCALDEHSFTVDVVVDGNLFRTGEGVVVEDRLSVASLETLLKMKAATLVSRAGEKDLFDLCWLFEHFPELSLPALLEQGREIDGGVNPEAVLLSLSSARLEEAACGFGIGEEASATAIFKKVSALRQALLRELSLYLHAKETQHPLGELVKALKMLEKKRAS
jgi:hypothetical protein